jgi:hypothetical protein
MAIVPNAPDPERVAPKSWRWPRPLRTLRLKAAQFIGQRVEIEPEPEHPIRTLTTTGSSHDKERRLTLVKRAANRAEALAPYPTQDD